MNARLSHAREAQCGDTEFPPICDACGENIRKAKTGRGKRAVTYMECDCTPAPKPETSTKPRRCSPKSTKRKGRQGELKGEREWSGWGFDAQSTVGSGAAGSRDAESAFDTDLVVRFGREVRLKVESKKHKSLPITSVVKLLSGSDLLRLEVDADEAKKHGYPGRTFYFGTQEAFGELVKWAAEGLRRSSGA